MALVEKGIIVLLRTLEVALKGLCFRTNNYEIAFKIAQVRGELTELFGMIEMLKNEKRASAKALSLETDFTYASDYQFNA